MFKDALSYLVFNLIFIEKPKLPAPAFGVPASALTMRLTLM